MLYVISYGRFHKILQQLDACKEESHLFLLAAHVISLEGFSFLCYSFDMEEGTVFMFAVLCIQGCFTANCVIAV